MTIAQSLRKVRSKVAGFSLAMLVMSMFTVSVAQAATFQDVPADQWFYPYVEKLAADGVLNTSTGIYRPGDLANRAEMAKLVVEAFDLPLENPDVPTFKDVPKSAWFYQYVETAAKHGIVSGYKDNTGVLTGYYGPADPVTREQAMKMLVLGAPLTTNTTGGPHFTDVPQSRWSYEYVETGYNWSVVDGYPGTTLFKPDNNINRAEIAKMVANSMDPTPRPGSGFQVEDASATALNMVEVCFSAEPDASAMDAANYDIQDLDGNALAVTDVSDATDPMCVDLTTANQTAGLHYDLLVSNVMSAAGEELTIPDVTFTGFMAGGTGGDLNCTAGEQPAAVSVPRGATGIPFTVVNCQASSDPVVISGMTFHRFGSGDEGDFTNVYLYAGDYRLTTGRSINSETQEVEFTGLNYALAANESVSFIVIGDFAVTAAPADQHAFELVNADSVESNASSVDGDFPIKGNFMTVAGTTAGTVTISKNGSLDDVTVGETARIAQFELEASGTEAMKLDRIALYLRGTCDSSDVTDFVLKVEGGSEVLATADMVGAKDLVTFTLDNPFVIPQGDNKIFYVEAKNTCRNAETIKTYLDETTDLHVIGTTFNTGVQVTNNYDGTTVGGVDQFSLVTVKGSDFNVAFNGPTAGDIAVGQDRVSCLDLTITNASGEDVEIKDWKLTIDVTTGDVAADTNDLINSTDSTPNYTLIKLARMNDDGTVASTLLGPSELAVGGSDVTQDVVLAGSNTIHANESVNASIIMNIANNTSLNNDKIRCTLDNVATTGADYVRDLNGDELGAESITPSSDITGNIMTITSAGLTFGIASTPTSRTYVRGATGVDLLGLTVRSGSSLDNTIKSLTLQGYVDSDTLSTFAADGTAEFGTFGDSADTILKDVVDNLALYQGNTKVSDIENVNVADGKLILNNLNLLIPKNTTNSYTIRGNVNHSAPYGTLSDRLKFGLASTTDVVAIDQNGQTVSSGSIVDNATNDAALNSGTIMTITAGGSGVVSNSSSTNQKARLLVGSTAQSVGQWKFDATDEDLMLKDLTFLTYDTNSSSSVQFYVNGVATGPSYPVESNGTILVKDINIAITDATPVTLEGRLMTNQVNPGYATSGDHVGMALMSVDEVTSGAGANIAPTFMGTVTPRSTVSVASPTTGAGSDILCSAADLLVTAGDMLKVDDEYMVAQSASAASVPCAGFSTVVGRWAPVTHSVGGAISFVDPLGIPVAGNRLWVEAAAGVGAQLVPGDIAYNTTDVNADLLFNDYCVVLANTVAANDTVAVLVSNNAITCPVTDATYVSRFVQHGDVSVLRKAKPTFTNVALAGPFTLGSSDLTMQKINIAATGVGDVSFKNANGNTLEFTRSGSFVSATCRLMDSLGNELSPAIANVGNVYTFDFATSDLVIAAGSSETVEVRCDTSLATAPPTVQENLSLTDATYSDGDVANISTDTALFQSTFPLVGSTFSLS